MAKISLEGYVLNPVTYAFHRQNAVDELRVQKTWNNSCKQERMDSANSRISQELELIEMIYKICVKSY